MIWINGFAESKYINCRIITNDCCRTLAPFVEHQEEKGENEDEQHKL